MSDSEFELEFSDNEAEQQQALEEAHIKIKNEQDRIKEEQQLEEVQAQRRLTSIEESYQRYLCYQRLDEINFFALGLLKEQLGLRGVAVDSVMATFNLRCPIDVQKLIKFTPNATLKRYSRSSVGIDLHHPKTHLSVTAAGAVSIMGAKTTSEAYLAARRIACIVNTHLNQNAKVTGFGIRNIVLQVVYPDAIDLAGLERSLKGLGLSCFKQPNWNYLELKFVNTYLPLVQPQMPTEQQIALGSDNSGGAGFSTLTGGYTGVKQDFNQSAAATTPAPITPALNDVKQEVGSNQTIVGDAAGQANVTPAPAPPQSAPPTTVALPTMYPPEFDYSFTFKIFGAGSIIIMGLESIAMGVIAAHIITGLVKTYNRTYEYTQSKRFGEFVSRSVNIADAHSNVITAKAAASMTYTTAKNNNDNKSKRQKTNLGAPRKVRRGRDDESEFSDEDSDMDD